MTNIMQIMEGIKEGERIRIKLANGSGLIYNHRVKKVEVTNGGEEKTLKIELDFFFILVVKEKGSPRTFFQNSLHLSESYRNVEIERLPS